MKPKLLILIAMFFAVNITYGQSINFRFNNYVYGWQRIDTLSNSSSAKTTHLRGYQNYLLDINSGKWTFNTLAQTEEDIINKVDKGFHYRFYNLYVKGSNLFDLLDLKLGRQNLFAGVGKGTLDGLHLKIKSGKNKEYQLALFGGIPAPSSYEFENFPKLKDNFHFGAQFIYYGVKDLMAGLSYSNKKQTPESYSTIRLDSVFNPVTREVTLDGPSEQLAGFDINYTYLGKHNFYSKVYYDIELKKLYRAEINARVSIKDNLRAFAEYNYREPHFTYNSIFWVFAYSKYQELQGGLDYSFDNGIIAYGKVGAVFYENDNSVKVQAGFSNANYGFSFIKYMGYAGESDGISGYYQNQIYEDILSASASVSYSRYRLGDIYETDKVNSFSGMLGVTYRPMPQLSVDAQGQLLINRIYESDMRFLIGLNYWLFKKF